MNSALLVFAPVGGLGNRMRAMASAVHFASEHGHRLHIIWQTDSECHAKFEELFEIPRQSATFSIEEGTFADKPASRRNLWLPRLLRLGHYAADNSYYRPHIDTALSKLLQKGDCHIISPYSVSDYPVDLTRRLFKPTANLDKKIENIAAGFTERTIGVHIRRTDNTKAIAESPLEAFIIAIRELLASGDADNVFLCSDDAMVKKHLKSIFGLRIITREEIATQRNCLAAIQDAVVDLYALARTNLVLGSYWSSFSDMAAELGQIPLRVIRRKQDSRGRNGDLELASDL